MAMSDPSKILKRELEFGTAGQEANRSRDIDPTSKSEQDLALDLALEETFPASDPVSITISEVVQVRAPASD